MALSAGDESVKAHVSIVQGVISRMAANSASCKTWCVTIVTALFALAIDKGKPHAILIGLLPLGLFLFLDAYYLSLENDFRSIYNRFIAKIRASDPTAENDLYELKLEGNCFSQRIKKTARQLGSFSIWPFYGIIVITLVITYTLIKPATVDTQSGSTATPSPTVATKTR